MNNNDMALEELQKIYYDLAAMYIMKEYSEEENQRKILDLVVEVYKGSDKKIFIHDWMLKKLQDRIIS